MNILFLGGNQLGAIALENLIIKGINITAVIITDTNDNWYSGVDKIAEKYNLKLIKTKNINSSNILKEIEYLECDLLVSVNFNQILKKELINIPKRGCINVHASLLPAYRGRAPLNWAILNGEKEVGVTVHEINEKIDCGDIILQEKIVVEDSEYIGDILNKVKEMYKHIVYDAIKLIESGNIKKVKQPEDYTLYYKKRTAYDGEIKLDKSCNEIINLIRAVSKPYPGAFLIIENKKYIIWRAKLDKTMDIKFNNCNIGSVIKEEDKILIKLKDNILIADEFEIIDI